MSHSLDANISVLQQFQPQVAQRMRGLDLGRISQKFHWEEDSGIQLFQESKLLDSTKFSEQYNIPESSVLFLEGFGLGVNLQRALQVKAKTYVVIEPSLERFAYSLSLTHFASLFKEKEIIWIVGEDHNQFFSTMLQTFRKIPRSLYMDDFSFIKHPVLSSQYSGYFDRLRDEWDACRTQIRRNYGNLEDSILGLKNVLSNRSFIENSLGISAFKNKFSGVPAVIASAGPSLKKSLQHLKEVQDKALIIANDATASVLLDQGITPHFVCTLERGEASKKFFEAIATSTDAVLVSYPIVSPNVIQAFPGRKICAYRDYGIFKFLDQILPRGILPSSSSVAHMCVRLADYMGCSDAILVGQDLSFDVETLQSHVDGVAYSDWSKKNSLEELERQLTAQGELLTWVPGNLDSKVPTSSTYFSFLKEFSWEASQLKINIINSTEGGAQIPGILWKNFKEATQILSERPIFRQQINDILDIEMRGHLDLSLIKNQLKDFDARLSQLAEQGNLFKNQKIDSGTKRSIEDLLLIAKTELIGNPVFQSFVIETHAREFLELENQLNKSPVGGRLSILEKWFQEMKRSLDKVQQVLVL